MPDVVELLSRPAVLGSLVLAFGYIFYQLVFSPSPLPDLPILNAKEGEWFPFWRAAWRNTTDFKAACKLAASQYKDEPCIVPLLGIGNHILLPGKLTKFVIDQPRNVLNLHESASQSLQTDYTMEPGLVRNPVHHPLIVTTLTNQIGNLVPSLAEETEPSLKELWGTDTTGFRDVCVYTTLQKVIGRVTNRVFVGAPLCHDPNILRLGIAFAQDVPLGSSLLKLFPSFLRPIVSLGIMLPNRLHERAFAKLLRPEIERRLREYDERKADPEKKAREPEPNDFLQWMVNQAKESGDPYLMKPRTLALRILILNFASIHTSSFAITGAIFDLISHNKAYIEELREEIATVLAEHSGTWNKKALSNMVKLDSVMRESQRVNSFVTVGLGRTVLAPEGLTTPDGLHIAQGNTVYVPGYALHHDPEIYPDPDEFRPFRFSEIRQQQNPSSEGDEFLKRARQQWATTTKDYLAFGHGRDACPGRFFAATELKLMLAHIIMAYDFEMLESRPRNTWLGLNRVPPMAATIRVRRREKV